MRFNENINELANKFFDRQSGEEFISDHEKLERLWSNIELSPSAVANVKAAVNRELMRRQYAVIARRVAAVAAVVIIAGISLLVMTTRQKIVEPAPVIVTNIWESQTIAEDENISAFADEIAEIEDALVAIRLGESIESDEYSYINELELELIEENNTFWKG